MSCPSFPHSIPGLQFTSLASRPPPRRKHLCLVFERLDVNLFELLKRNSFRGLSLSLVQLFLKQILNSLAVLRDASIIHCDLKV